MYFSIIEHERLFHTLCRMYKRSQIKFANCYQDIFFFYNVASHDFILVYQKSCLFSILVYFPCVSLHKNDESLFEECAAMCPVHRYGDGGC